MHFYNNKNTPKTGVVLGVFLCKLLIINQLCGVGGSRTLVQTCRRTAFYKFSLRLIVGYCTVRDQPHNSLSS